MDQSLHENTEWLEAEVGVCEGQEMSERDTGEQCLASPMGTS